jgi:hypothetical protein
MAEYHFRKKIIETKNEVKILPWKMCSIDALLPSMSIPETEKKKKISVFIN